MKITEIVLGVVADGRPVPLRITPKPAGLTLVPLEGPLTLAPEEVARAVRETLASPTRDALRAELPFVRVVAEAGELEVTVADDAGGSGRMLTETLEKGMPLVMETDAKARDKEDRDARIEALLARVAIAAGADAPETLLAALSHEASATDPRRTSPSAASKAYVDAQRRAVQLARDVRALDDRMTASVVPDWLWIATGLGGVGVLLTVVALLAPELRIYVIPAVVVLSILGFSAYGLRAWRELKIRSVLLAERRELRARREAARAEARALAQTLLDSGIDPDRAIVDAAVVSRAPLITGQPPSQPASITPIGDRQRILFVREVDEAQAAHVVRAKELEAVD